MIHNARMKMLRERYEGQVWKSNKSLIPLSKEAIVDFSPFIIPFSSYISPTTFISIVLPFTLFSYIGGRFSVTSKPLIIFLRKVIFLYFPLYSTVSTVCSLDL